MCWLFAGADQPCMKYIYHTFTVRHTGPIPFTLNTVSSINSTTIIFTVSLLVAYAGAVFGMDADFGGTFVKAKVVDSDTKVCSYDKYGCYQTLSTDLSIG
jgi:hypothetical protein